MAEQEQFYNIKAPGEGHGGEPQGEFFDNQQQGFQGQGQPQQPQHPNGGGQGGFNDQFQ